MKASTLQKILAALPEDSEFKIVQFDDYTADMVITLPDNERVQIAGIEFEAAK